MRTVRRLARRAAVVYASIALFERFAPRAAVRRYQRLANRVQAPLAGLLPGWAVLETIGRRTGLRRQVPVGGRLVGSSFWLVAGAGRESAFVRNIEADPRVRLRVHGRWRPGTAHLLPTDDALRRLLVLNPVNSLFVGVANPVRTMLTVRVDLDDRSSERPRGLVTSG